MHVIDPREVNAVLGEAISETGTLVEGVMSTYGVDIAKLEQYRQTYKDWIAQLDPSFLTSEEGGGGGWSMLQLVADKDGELWTGEHRTAERLFVGAKALGMAQFVAPRAIWRVMPGGMPYMVFTLKDEPLPLPDFTSLEEQLSAS